MKWKYRTAVVRPHEGDDHLNQIGAEGWELIGLVETSAAVRCYFKRPVEEPDETTEAKAAPQA